MSRGPRRIVLNGLFLDYPFSGTWTYTRNLPQELVLQDTATRYSLAVRRGELDGDSEAIATIRPRWPNDHAPGSSWMERIDKFGWEQIALSRAVRGADIVHSLYFAAPLICPAPLVVTIHDTISMQSEYLRGHPARVYSFLMRKACRRAAAIITVSQHARDEIARGLSYPIDRIHVTHEAADPTLCRVNDTEILAAVRTRYELPDSYVLYLGGTERRKNIETLVRAWARIGSGSQKLVIVGGFPGHGEPMFPDIPALARSLGIQESVQFIPRIAQTDLAAVYSQALAFCFPSTYEGFGLPPVEAMACGVPVLAAAASCLPEILGDGAELIEPLSDAAWADAISRVCEDGDYRDDLRRRGSEWVKRYAWELTAKKTIDVYDRVLSV